jgi:thiol-disulfide isomerase/thioredoxin
MTAIFFFSSSLSFGQAGGNTRPFVIRGQITNFQGKQLLLVIKDEGRFLVDTLPLDTEGRFYLKTHKLKGPQNWVQLAGLHNFQTALYIAPGYDLLFTADGRDGASFQKSKKISGIGAIINNYEFALEKNNRDWFAMNEQDLIGFVGEDKRYSDSLYHLYFNKKKPDDPYFEYFKKMARFDNVFRRLNYLVCHADDSASWSYDKAEAFVRKNFSNDTLLHHLSREEYLVSGDYASLMVNEYPAYLRKMDCRKGLFDCSDNSAYSVQIVGKVGAVYTGKVRQIALYLNMRNSLRNCRSFEELHNEGNGFPAFISALENKDQQAELQRLLESKGTELAKTQIGLPAPLFDAKDSSGKICHIADYNGKVIYIDLWASWCAPCRGETPYLKSLYEKYKGDDRIAFVSVAVQDSPDNWKKAMLEDKPTWTQLLDTDGQVQSSYVANSIPKFILVDKQFKIVSFDAPPPSDTTNLERLLDKELAK